MSEGFETRHYINGKFVESKKKFTLKNPATGKKLADISRAGEEEVEAAITAAAAAQKKWIALSGAERAVIMCKWADLIEQNSDKLASLDSQSMGRPIGLYPDAMVTSTIVKYVASLAVNVHGHSSLLTPGQVSMVVKQPYGVTAGLVPWNGPAMMFGQKAAHAVAAGNAIIMKSSEKSPLSASLLSELTKEAGFPDGLIQHLSGPGETGKLLAEHPQIRKVSFTGSTRTGREIMKSSANSNLKSISLELGGKSPTIVFDDANLEDAISGCTMSIAFNSGQICAANSRVYVQAKIYEKFLEGFKESFSKFSHGDPSVKETMLGPQADEIQANIVKQYLEIGNKDGKAILGGKAGEGNYIHPTIFVDVDENSRINKEEIFGPVAVVHKFIDEDEVIAKANDSEYGLHASVYTTDIDRAMRVATKLESGNVGVNCHSSSIINGADLPFGGFKQSGIGRELGKDALNAWLEEKSIFIKTKGL